MQLTVTEVALICKHLYWRFAHPVKSIVSHKVWVTSGCVMSKILSNLANMQVLAVQCVFVLQNSVR